jgi:murein DD-endopeptidase MepM/ murein hydrolase activator NlpD
MRGINPLQKYNKLGKLTVPFGGQTKQEAFHPGVDFANEKGTPIPSTVQGMVVKAEGGHTQGENNFGNTVEVKDINGDVHQFHHLDSVNVQPGDQVKPGQQIATMGNSGATYSQSGLGDGTHLDYRIVNAYGKYKNPMTYLKNL